MRDLYCACFVIAPCIFVSTCGLSPPLKWTFYAINYLVIFSSILDPLAVAFKCNFGKYFARRSGFAPCYFVVAFEPQVVASGIPVLFNWESNSQRLDCVCDWQQNFGVVGSDLLLHCFNIGCLCYPQKRAGTLKSGNRGSQILTPRISQKTT